MAEHDPIRNSTIAPAKLNLSLRVWGKRPDGFHDIESVTVKVTLFDGIDILAGGDSRITVICNEPSVPIDARNLVWQAAQLLADTAGITPSLTLHLHKKIPAGAGLGGGSSDAAATLALLNRIWELDWPAARLEPLAARIGSDVPLFLHPGAIVIRGRGERLQPVQLDWAGWFVLVTPPWVVSTPAVYARWRHVPSPGDALACTTARTAAELDAALFNDLTPCVFAVEPRLAALQDALRTRTARSFHLTGSGAALFACCDTHDEAVALHLRVGALPDAPTRIVRTLTSSDPSSPTA